MSELTKFNTNVINELEYYVYVYSDPDTKKPFYVGKGKGNRCFDHMFQKGESAKLNKIKEIQERGKKPVIEILAHGIQNEETALKIEAAAIDLIGIDNLTNEQKGHHSSVYGRIDVDKLNLRYNQEMLSLDDITDNVIMIRINQFYHYGMSEMELYDATRCSWRISIDNAKRVKYAFSIYDGMILEVYEITAWLPAHSTMHSFADLSNIAEKDKGRYEFVGVIAKENVRKKYVGKMVNNLFAKGNQNPVKYIIRD